MTVEPELNESPAPTPSQRGVGPGVFYLVALIVFLSDQASKVWIQRVLGWEQSMPVFRGILSLTLTRNTGGAWGKLPDCNALFIVFAAVAIVALTFAYHRMPRAPLLVGAALSLALGGACGNLLDRLRYGYVVDFFYLQCIRFPIFNIADSAISLGIGLLLLHFLRTWRDEREFDGDVAALPNARQVEESGKNTGF